MPLHPVHMIYLMFHIAVGALKDHTGFESLLIKDKSMISLSHLYHQLHHRYFDCNYGTSVMPWDKWFGSFHDGTPEATARVKKQHANRFRKQAG